jgi:hypothetical protein
METLFQNSQKCLFIVYARRTGKRNDIKIKVLQYFLFITRPRYFQIDSTCDYNHSSFLPV